MAGVVWLLWEHVHVSSDAPGSVHPALRAGNPLFHATDNTERVGVILDIGIPGVGVRSLTDKGVVVFDVAGSTIASVVGLEQQPILVAST